MLIDEIGFILMPIYFIISRVCTNERYDIGFLLGAQSRIWETPEGRKNRGDHDGRENLTGLPNWKSECFFIYTNLIEPILIHVVPKHKKYYFCLQIYVIFIWSEVYIIIGKVWNSRVTNKNHVGVLSLEISQTVIVQ